MRRDVLIPVCWAERALGAVRRRTLGVCEKLSDVATEMCVYMLIMNDVYIVLLCCGVLSLVMMVVCRRKHINECVFIFIYLYFINARGKTGEILKTVWTDGTYYMRVRLLWKRSLYEIIRKA